MKWIELHGAESIGVFPEHKGASEFWNFSPCMSGIPHFTRRKQRGTFRLESNRLKVAQGPNLP
jgi:hypothetical protein